MKILYVVDGRSPIAHNWIRYFVEMGHEVHLVSMFDCQPNMALTSLTIIPVAFSGAVEQGKADTGIGGRRIFKKAVRKFATPQVRTWLRHHFVPRSLPKAACQLRALIDELQPDLVHAMRIPYEGMLAALALENAPKPIPALMISVWGNDFTLHAPATRRLGQLTRLTMARADALHTDCHNDRRMALSWGYDPDKPSVVLPGAGGVQLDLFKPTKSFQPLSPTVINPRRLRAYVRNDTFFAAVPQVLERSPQMVFLCPSMQNQPEAESWVSRLGVGESLKLLPRLSRAQMADAFRQSQIVLSITTHDGTPNSLLEALACGCFPIVGDIPSLREWITHGVNGFLLDPDDPQMLAETILDVLADPALRQRACEHNQKMIAERAGYDDVMKSAETFYKQLS